MDFALPDALVALGDEAGALARGWAAEHVLLPEDSWLLGHSPDFARELAARRWIGMTWPTAEGGGGRSALERFVVYEALVAYGAPVASMWFADRQMGPTLLRYGTPEQRRRWLPGIIAGESMWCIGMSEPDAGSDVASLRTRAEPDGDDWVVNGQKVWTSGAAFADWCYCVARTDPDTARHTGLSEFVLDMRSPGVEARPIVDMTTNAHFCEVYLRDVRVPADHLIGAVNGSFGQLMRQMEHERGGIDRLLSNYALYRDVRASGLVDGDDPMVRQELAALETGYHLGRLLVLRETLGQAPAGFSAATKAYCTEFEQRVAGFCARVVGPAATLWGATHGLGGRAARAVCYGPAYTIMGGTSEILRNILGERVLGLPR
ncbi:MAG: acyl-CoA dehydrogenase family protein [Acidimicrobiia bacterium]